jgi:hypothetical protein
MARAKGLENARLDSAVIYSGQDTLYRILCTEYIGAAREAGEISGGAEDADRLPRIPALWHGGGGPAFGPPPPHARQDAEFFLQFNPRWPGELFTHLHSRLLFCCSGADFWRDAFERLARHLHVIFERGQGLRGEALDRGVFAVARFAAERGDTGLMVSHHIAGVGAVKRAPGKSGEAGIGSLIL